MIAAYFNYPNSRITIHHDSSCSAIRQAHKEGQRYVRIDVNTIGTELKRFNNNYSFGSTSDNNDMWVIVDFSDQRFERELISYIKRVLGVRYKPFHASSPEVHCDIA